MKIIVAPDKWKGTLTARLASKAIEHGIKEVMPDAEVLLFPMADGGEGSLDILSDYMTLDEQEVVVQDPMGRSIVARYGLSGRTAYIETSRSNGLQLLAEHEQNPLFTSTYGIGEMILDAIMQGAEEVYLFLGGSSTNDMGIGMASALGYRFLDADQMEVPPVGVATPFVMAIEKDLKYDPSKVTFHAICDVINPLVGPNGATHKYARQKGASSRGIDILEKGMLRMQKRCYHDLDAGVFSKLAMTGTAGGLGAGVLTFLKGQLHAGTGYFIDIHNLAAQLGDADLVITGEGRVDPQSFDGKVVGEIFNLAQQTSTQSIAFSGQRTDDLATDMTIMALQDQEGLSGDAYYDLRDMVIKYLKRTL